MDRHGVSRVGPRCHRGSIRPDPPVLDQENLVAVDGDSLGLPDDQWSWPGWVSLAIAEQPGFAQERPGMAQRQLHGVLAAACERGTPRQRFGRRDAVDPAPVEDDRHREFVAEGDIEGLAALEPEFRPLQ